MPPPLDFQNEMAYTHSVSNTGKYAYDKETREWVKVSEKANGLPDVYFKSAYYEPHLGTDGSPFGQRVASKRHKAALMRAQGVSECGDRVHGAR